MIDRLTIIDGMRSLDVECRDSLRDIHTTYLGAHVMNAPVDRNTIPDSEYDVVNLGPVNQLGSLGSATCCEGSDGCHCQLGDFNNG